MKRPSAEFINYHLYGRCDAFAVALSQITNWKIKALWITDAYAPFPLLHVWTVREDGMAVDARGQVSEEELLLQYQKWEFKGKIFTGQISCYSSAKEFLADSRIRSDFSYAVSEAEKVVSDYLSFYLS